MLYGSSAGLCFGLYVVHPWKPKVCSFRKKLLCALVDKDSVDENNNRNNHQAGKELEYPASRIHCFVETWRLASSLRIDKLVLLQHIVALLAHSHSTKTTRTVYCSLDRVPGN